MYLNYILSIKRNAEIKLLALERINKEHRILRFFKRNALQNKITNLIGTLYSLNFSGRGLILNSLACINEYKSLTEEDKKYLKSKESNNMFDDILNSGSRLAFLLSLKRGETLEFFFKNYIVDRYYYIKIIKRST